jgi:quercetin dioxygenase-like cupin family protein
MHLDHARSGDLLDIDPGAARNGLTGSVALIRDERLEVMRWVLPAGRSVPEHMAYGPVTIQCVEGATALRLPGEAVRLMRPGSLVYLAPGERHALEALADSVLLVTMVLAAPPAGTTQLQPDGEAPPTHGERTARMNGSK